MSKYRLRITLLSDLCTSSGGIYNDAVDTEVTCDSHGLPYIPGKRLKGCLRECALEINDWGGTIRTEKIFGLPGNSRGALSIRNAYPENYQEWNFQLEKAHGNLLSHPQNVLNSFTYLRTQTEISQKTGVAKRNSLRTMRVVKRGTVFCADIELPRQYEQELILCCRAFRHMGIARTRGFGEIKAELESAEESRNREAYAVPKDVSALTYEIILKEPLILKSVERQEGRSLDYIEGSKILGLIVQKLKDKGSDVPKFMDQGKFRVTNAYLTDKEGHRLTEVPCAFFGVKNRKEEYRNKIYEDGNEHLDQGLQLNMLKHSYVHRRTDGELEQHQVQMMEHYHHSLPDDKSIGRTIGEGEDGGVFYQISAICEDQSFQGRIEGTPEQITYVAGLFQKEETVHIGYGRSSEYGTCCFRLKEYHKDTADVTTKDFAVELIAPTIIYGKNASYSTNTKDLVSEILACLHLDDQDLLKMRCFDRIITTGGFNVTWKMRKPTIAAFDKGTTLVIHMKNPVIIPSGSFWIGERTPEGYGECRIIPLEKEGIYAGHIAEQDIKKEIVPVDINETPLLGKIADDLMDDFLTEQACILAAKTAVSAAERPVVNNMLLMISASGASFESVRADCEHRYMVKDAGKQAKGSCAGKILNTIECEVQGSEEEKSVRELFEERYQIKGYEPQNLKKRYLKAYLQQLKYRIRSREHGSGKEDAE